MRPCAKCDVLIEALFQRIFEANPNPQSEHSAVYWNNSYSEHQASVTACCVLLCQLCCIGGGRV